MELGWPAGGWGRVMGVASHLHSLSAGKELMHSGQGITAAQGIIC